MLGIFSTFLGRKVEPKNFNEGKAWVRTLRAFKVFAQAFFKKLAVSKGRALVARRNERNLLNGAFLFAKLFLLVGAGARPVGDEASAINGKNKEH